MELSAELFDCRRSLIERVEISGTVSSPLEGHPSLETITHSCDPLYSSKGVATNTPISGIFGWGRWSKVFPSIVCAVKVYVVHLISWPLTNHVQICEPTSQKSGISNLNLKMAGSIDVTDLLSTAESSKFTRVWAAVKQGLKSFLIHSSTPRKTLVYRQGAL